MQAGHAWYPHEIRIVRNHIGVLSCSDAQSFLRCGQKLHVASANAEMFHYGYVRDPRLMQRRNVEIETTYRGREEARKLFDKDEDAFDFGPLDKRTLFKGTHPAVMQDRIRSMNWKHLLQYNGVDKTHYHHDRFKYRFLTFLEQKFLGGQQIGGFKNYVLLKNL